MFILHSDEHVKRFDHVIEGTKLKSRIAIEQLLCEDFEMFLLVSLIGSELHSNHTSETIYWKHIETMGKLFETNNHIHLVPKPCVRCSVERTYCKTLAIIDATKALCGNITLMELSAIVLSSENIFLERESILVAHPLNIRAKLLEKMPLISICKIGDRLKYWNLLRSEVQIIYRDRAMLMLQQLTKRQRSSDIMYNIDL